MLGLGTRLGAYEVVAAIGAGGMGEVYKAKDTRLDRFVAIKVLPELFAYDPERLARFEREAKTLAALNHPNIAQIYGVEESNGTRALVMELVEGETLAERIARRPIPVDEALPIAGQIAEALEGAHDQGIVHRDLKPANINVRPDGAVKVLDFGLAKLTESALSSGSNGPNALSMSPTITSPAMTGVGVLLGTAAYMSPEQARGKSADKRADIWAFGCVLYEMLSGRRAFEDEDVSMTLSKILLREPDFDALPPTVPARVRQVLRVCLRKDPKQRVSDIRDVCLALDGAFETTAPQIPAATPNVSHPLARAVWATVGAVSVAALCVAVFVYSRSPAPAAEAIRFFISAPDALDFQSQVDPTGVSPVPMAVSPDGRRLAFVAVDANNNARLFVRPLDGLTAQALAGTDGASSPFWSPDGRSLGFFASGKLKKIALTGGPSITLCDAPSGRGGAWSRDGIIVFNPANTVALYKVAASGGTPTAATVLSAGEAAHRRPFFLPDGRHFIYTASISGAAARPLSVYVASLDSNERKLLMTSDVNNVVYSRGHLLFLRGQTLMAQPFDAPRLETTGDAFPIAEQIQRSQNSPPQNGFFSASDNGVLAYQAGAATTGSQLVWFDRSGKQFGVLGDAAAYEDIELAPDGKRAAVSLPTTLNGSRDIWLYDVARGLKNRFTFDAADETQLIWSPDGREVVFTSNRRGQSDLYQKAADGSGAEEVLLADKGGKVPVSWSPDGNFILYVNAGGSTRSDVFALPLRGDRKPVPILTTPFAEPTAAFSPDGRWIAYESDESGRSDVYVIPFQGPGGKRQISTGGGSNPRWRRDGTEIFYLDPQKKLMAATVNGRGASFEVDVVKALFQTRVAGPRFTYATPDGQRFLINTAPESVAASPITVVVNWMADLK